jgi:hypothetical protein
MTFLGSVFQMLRYMFKRGSSIGQWRWVWLGSNFSQLFVVVVLLSGLVGGTWGFRLLVLAIVSAVILIIDFYLQLLQLAKPGPQQEPVADEDEVILGP